MAFRRNLRRGPSLESRHRRGDTARWGSDSCPGSDGMAGRPVPKGLGDFSAASGGGGRGGMALTTDAQGRHSALHEQDQHLFDSAEYANQGPDFAAIRNGAEFGVLRRRLRRFIFPMSALFMGWYMTFVLLA